MAARVAINGLGCAGRSVLTKYALDVAGVVCVTARKTTDSEGNEIFRHVADDDLSAVTGGYDNEQGRVQQTVRQALAILGEAAAPR
ncbi:hypothetical protein XF35_17100 [Streptomyces platensis subsp. clarensis]|nr:hypothetical protein [Streptomyces platensis subsp. clarensis]